MAHLSRRLLRARHRLLTALALAAVVLLPQEAIASSLEQAVKASYLFKFAPFVEWPPRAFIAPNSPFLICLAGQDPFGSLIDDAVRGQKVSGHPIALRRLTGSVTVGGCHILFMGRPPAQADAVVPDLTGQPMLTISDRTAGVTGGMIEFVMQSGRVRFQIDQTAARANGLIISSKLLGLAVAVDRR